MNDQATQSTAALSGRPTAEKAIEGIASFRSAEGVRIAALLPPSSRRQRPSLLPTAAATCLPIDTDPVADTSGMCSASAQGELADIDPFLHFTLGIG